MNLEVVSQPKSGGTESEALEIGGCDQYHSCMVVLGLVRMVQNITVGDAILQCDSKSLHVACSQF